MPMRQDDGQLISVLMGVLYRRESIDLLERSVKSIQGQTYRNFELLICDDGSTEAASRYLDETVTQDERVRLIRGCKKTDLASKLNRCLSEAKGSYIARMDDDDYAHPDRFEKQTACLNDHPEASFLGCSVSVWDGSKITGKWVFPEYPEVKDFLFQQPFVHPSMMFRRKVLLSVGGYSEDSHCVLCEDYDLLLRLYAAGYRGMNQQEVLLDYTVMEAAHSNRKIRHRWNETVTRYRRFKSLKLLPSAWTYVIKPIAVGLVPKKALRRIKKRWYKKGC